MITREKFRFASASGMKAALLAGVLAGSTIVLRLPAQTVSQPGSAGTAAGANAGPAAKPAPAASSNTFVPSVPRRERAYYDLFWGVDSLRAKAVESGELIQFSYRVLDPDRARGLNDKNNEAILIAPDLRAKLIIPSLEKVGQLRQTSTPEQGKRYWMAFSNPGRVVKRGDRVNVSIGKFHVDGLVVE
jgi:hypothetical protein